MSTTLNNAKQTDPLTTSGAISGDGGGGGVLFDGLPSGIQSALSTIADLLNNPDNNGQIAGCIRSYQNGASDSDWFSGEISQIKD
ncbi:hypothetical protein [Edaphobacter modestus]|uniref:Uncharacterized protein n=1 Tax=Edaphobacter modestus TaxID=388466 RepID=A0A4Q7YH68_9BACT|nr:hypothetical protein [Edaphobacter modestus]RZU35699.1 hypothetical protein BDD14_5791 [Edaphobacter modestus]